MPSPTMTISVDAEGRISKIFSQREPTIYVPCTEANYFFSNAVCRLSIQGEIVEFSIPLTEKPEAIYPFGKVASNKVGLVRTKKMKFVVVGDGETDEVARVEEGTDVVEAEAVEGVVVSDRTDESAGSGSGSGEGDIVVENGMYTLTVDRLTVKNYPCVLTMVV
jgi:hypothetical protein